MFFYTFLSRIELDGEDAYKWIPTRLTRKSKHPFQFPIEKGKYNAYAVFTNRFGYQENVEPLAYLKRFSKSRRLFCCGDVEPEVDFLLPFVLEAEHYNELFGIDGEEIEGILVYRQKQIE